MCSWYLSVLYIKSIPIKLMLCGIPGNKLKLLAWLGVLMILDCIVYKIDPYQVDVAWHSREQVGLVWCAHDT